MIDPKDYPFRHHIEKNAHLDTDELRHTIKPIIQIIDKDFKGQEHKFCDKEQLCPLGKYRRPKLLVEAESKGFTSSLEMEMANRKAEEDKKQKEIDLLLYEVKQGQEARRAYDDLRQYKTLSDERFEKMGRLIADQNKMLEFLMSKLK